MGGGLSISRASEVFEDLTSYDDLAFYFKNAVGISSGASGVTGWTDSSDENNDLTQTGEDNMGSSTQGGISFDGTNDYYTLGSNIDIGNENPFTFFIVLNMGSGLGTVLGTPDSTEQYVGFTRIDTIKIKQTAGATILGDTSRPFANGETMALCVTKDKNRNYRVFKNNGGVIDFSSVTLNPGEAGAFILNQIGMTSTGSANFVGIMHELGLYTVLLSDGQINTVLKYLVNKFSI